MSQAFVKENEDQWLGDVSPTILALARFLTRENNGIKVTGIRTYHHPKIKKEVHEMSNGFTYTLDMDNRWEIVL